MNLSEAEGNAIAFLKSKGGSMLTSEIPEKNERNVFGGTDAGMAVYKKLEKKGLIFFTEEESFELESGLLFTWTNEVCLVTN